MIHLGFIENYYLSRVYFTSFLLPTYLLLWYISSFLSFLCAGRARKHPCVYTNILKALSCECIVAYNGYNNNGNSLC